MKLVAAKVKETVKMLHVIFLQSHESMKILVAPVGTNVLRKQTKNKTKLFE